MSSSLYIFIGPYISCKPKNVEVIKVKRSCPQHPNRDQKDAKYCPICGTLINSIDYTDKRELSMKNVMYRHEEFSDNLVPCGDMDDILIPNQYPPAYIKVDTYSGKIADYTDTDLNTIKKSQLEWMEDFHVRELGALRKEFGEDIKIKWGIIPYWS